MIKLIACFAVSILPVIFLGCANDQPPAGPYPKAGLASWYDPSLTSPELFKKWGVTCAMRKTDYGKYYQVCNLANNKCIFVRHNDFGPSAGMYRKGRIIDLSKSAFRKIADLDRGIIKVSVNPVYEASVD
ncbi:MAG TPA: septal ring lytic transglycosylase RlpA family protein [Candidatus Omnitrophota bacterium]|nr:septal ring lytic transglycosylase RlpA family protein [Candidatus Omnitrophota bacterium]HPT39370.1 septal ring lytic transglycosylase RlpA family protein [Candidatus Omnitrophota bacterium]